MAKSPNSPPSLSVVIPMFNEWPRLDSGVRTILLFLQSRHPGCEVKLVDDGSLDDTVAGAEAMLRAFPELDGKILRLHVNSGKGAAVRLGMQEATGRIRMFADADNATPIEELDRLIAMVDTPRTIVIGSRGVEGARLERRQPFWREWMGRTFNAGLRLVVGLPFRDTQCGFKLFGSEAADACFSRQKIDGFAFDVELLWIAQRQGFVVKEVPVRWRHVPQSRVQAIRHSLQMARDALRIRVRGTHD